MSLIPAALIFIAAAASAYACLIFWGLRARGVGVWWRDYLRHMRQRPQVGRGSRPTEVMFCFVDHFEPRWEKPAYETEVERVGRWARDYPKICAGHSDADGRMPQHTFFYPSEEYRPEHLDNLVGGGNAGVLRRCALRIDQELHRAADSRCSIVGFGTEPCCGYIG